MAIEPKTGKVRALVSKPDFDPNKLDDMWNKITSDSSQSCLLNRATQGLYPPGSTYKILTALEYMEERPTTYKKFSYDCEGETIINSVRISCYENEEHGEVDLDRAFAKSCNTAFVTLGSKLDIKQFAALNKKCLFNQNIPFDLSVKKSRFELNEHSDKGEIPQTVIGQGNTTITPEALNFLTGALLNGGTLKEPVWIEAKRTSATAGEWEELESEKEYVMCQDVADTVVQTLEAVMESGTGRSFAMPEAGLVGKTGTAEKADRNGNLSGMQTVWFTGGLTGEFGEANPIAITVAIDDVDSSVTSSAAGTFAKDILKYMLTEGGSEDE